MPAVTRIGGARPDPVRRTCAVLGAVVVRALHLGGMCDTAGARWLRCTGGISLAAVRAILAGP